MLSTDRLRHKGRRGSPRPVHLRQENLLFLWKVSPHGPPWGLCPGGGSLLCRCGFQGQETPAKTPLPKENVDMPRERGANPHGDKPQESVSPFGTGRFCQVIVISSCLSCLELTELTHFYGNSPIFSTHILSTGTLNCSWKDAIVLIAQNRKGGFMNGRTAREKS